MNEPSGWLLDTLDRTKQLWAERQASAGAGGDSQKFTTIHHESSGQVCVTMALRERS
jgi:hypothetical protein